jgi:hypothetical protein
MSVTRYNTEIVFAAPVRNILSTCYIAHRLCAGRGIATVYTRAYSRTGLRL